jgi:hypothetical protein
MNTREAYPKGCRVVATAKFRERYQRKFYVHPTTGVVVGHSRDSSRVRVQRDGQRSSRAYHWSFWDRII